MTTFLRPRLMNTRNALLLVVSHIVVAAAGFAGGIYALPILIAPAAPTAEEIQTATAQAQFTGQFKRDLKDSDSLHWGEGVVSVAPTAISLTGKLAPGPDYKLYLTPHFVDTEEAFLAIKDASARVGDVKTFNGFIVEVPADIDVRDYSTVVIWCEAFAQFISSAEYQPPRQARK